MLIRMLMEMPGGRVDGRVWPTMGGVLEVSDAEGFDLVRGETAAPGDNFAADRLREMGIEDRHLSGEPVPEPAPGGDLRPGLPRPDKQLPRASGAPALCWSVAVISPAAPDREPGSQI